VPAKNSIKEYEGNAYYHIYNRGVEKRNIFLDDHDYSYFLYCLKLYLSPQQIFTDNPKGYCPKKYTDDIDLLSYVLMPNHFHLLIKQHSPYAINSFMKSLCTKYSMHFNKQYKRVGSLFQGRYKAVKVDTDEQLVYLSKYIHHNPTKIGFIPQKYPYSSCQNYLNVVQQDWIKPKGILDFFSDNNPHQSYFSFINNSPEEDPIINSLTIDDLE